MRKSNIITLDDVLTMDNIRVAYKEVMKTCKNKKSKNSFNFNTNTNLYNIYNSLKNGTYKPLKYILFPIFEPKPRLVMSQSISDKIVNHFIAKFILIPNLEKKLSDNNIATRKNKGTSYGNKLMVDYINSLRQNGNVYCLKLDISKYFYNINHEILFNKLKKDNIDDKTLNIIYSLINETNNSYINERIIYINNKYNLDLPLYKYGVGLSIGAVINQFLAIYYLNDIIKYIKEELHIKYSLSYMDDIVILHNDKEYLKLIRKDIEYKINELKIEVNPKSTICSLSSGINFLGIRHYEYNGKYIRGYRKSTFNKINKKLNYLRVNNLILYNRSIASYHGYYLIINNNIKGDFKLKLIDKYNMYKDKYPNMIILIKEGTFYKTFLDDAVIIWYIFNYSYVDNYVSFGTKAYNKVFDELNRLHISYLCISDTELINNFDNDVYNIYLKLSKDSFKYQDKLNTINNKIKSLINNNKDNYNKIINYLDNIN